MKKKYCANEMYRMSKNIVSFLSSFFKFAHKNKYTINNVNIIDASECLYEMNDFYANENI